MSRHRCCPTYRESALAHSTWLCAVPSDALQVRGDTEPPKGMYCAVLGCRSAWNCSGVRSSLGAFANTRGRSSFITRRSTGFLSLDEYRSRSAPSASSTCRRALRSPVSSLTTSVMHSAAWLRTWTSSASPPLSSSPSSDAMSGIDDGRYSSPHVSSIGRLMGPVRLLRVTDVGRVLLK